jgi:hypothetical protein
MLSCPQAHHHTGPNTSSSCCCCCCCSCSPGHYSLLGPLAPKPTTYKLIGMLGAIISYMSIILLGYTAVGVSGDFS